VTGKSAEKVKPAITMSVLGSSFIPPGASTAPVPPSKVENSN